MSEFNPNLTQRVVRAAKKRVVWNWRSRLRDYSTIALASVTSIGALWVGLPEDIKARMPPWIAEYLGYVILTIGTWGTIGKFLTQPRNQPPEKDE